MEKEMGLMKWIIAFFALTRLHALVVRSHTTSFRFSCSSQPLLRHSSQIYVYEPATLARPVVAYIKCSRFRRSLCDDRFFLQVCDHHL